MKSARAWSVLNTRNKLSQIDVITKCVVKPFTPEHERPYSPHGSLYVSFDPDQENLYDNQEILRFLYSHGLLYLIQGS